jgi:DeoR family fructose operon transcriptional repressor
LTNIAARGWDEDVPDTQREVMRYTGAPQRRAELLRRVGAAGYLSSAAVAAELGVSEMTIRRDLRELAAQGLVNRVAGGASALVAPGAPFEARRSAAPVEKLAVARAAAGLLDDAHVVGLDAGTTVTELAGLLPGGLTVATHSVPVITTCAERDDLELIALGGSYHAKTRSFSGPITRAALSQLALDVAVLSAAAAGPAGVYSADVWDADTKQVMAGVADRLVLLLDSGKLGRRAPIRFLDLDLFDTVVVDSGVSTEHLATLRAAGPEVVVAEVPA